VLDWWKANRVREAAVAHGRTVWIDDDIDAWRNTLHLLGRTDESAWIGDEVLAVCPDTRSGLTRDHFDTIRGFLAS
jgi:hypothetical protein